jgi:hypothetical protein
MAKIDNSRSVVALVDKAVETSRRLDNRVTLEHRTANYFSGLTPTSSAEESGLEAALSSATQEIDFDQP